MSRWNENYDWAIEVGTRWRPHPVPGDYKAAANYAAAVIRNTPPDQRQSLRLLVWWQCFDRITLSSGRVLVDTDTATQEEYYIAAAMRNALTAATPNASAKP